VAAPAAPPCPAPALPPLPPAALPPAPLPASVPLELLLHPNPINTTAIAAAKVIARGL
jgi:hypothetical protein